MPTLDRRTVCQRMALAATGALASWSAPLAGVRADAGACASSRYSEWETVAYRPPEARRRVALSLAELQEALGSGSLHPEAPLPLTRVRGVARTADDLILLGVEEAGGGAVPLVPDDIAVAMRCMFLSDQPPGVSIDPVFDGGRMEEWQRVVYFGPVEGTRIGLLAFTCDYWMKEVAAGRRTLPVKGFCSYRERWLREHRPGDPIGTGSRFWFYPKESVFVTAPDGATMRLAGGGVDLLTEDMHLELRRGGARFVSAGTGRAGPSAAAFAEEMTHRYEELGLVFPDLIRLRNFFALCEIFKWLDSRRIDLARWTFLLHEYDAVGAHTPARAETVFVPVGSIDARTILALEGGVQILIRLPKVPFIDRAGEIVRELAQLLSFRPARGSSVWSY